MTPSFQAKKQLDFNFPLKAIDPNPQSLTPTYAVLSQTGAALVSSSICKLAAALQIPRVFPPGIPLRKCKSNPIPPIPGLKLSNKVDKSRAMPHPRMAADKCIAKDKPGC